MLYFVKKNSYYVLLSIILCLVFYGVGSLSDDPSVGSLFLFKYLYYGLIILIEICLFFQLITYLIIKKPLMNIMRWEASFLLVGSIVTLFVSHNSIFQFLIPLVFQFCYISFCFFIIKSSEMLEI